jgi:predicted HNH restriction endonuclease
VKVGLNISPDTGERRAHSFDLIEHYLKPNNIEEVLKTTTYLRVLVYLFLENFGKILDVSCPEGNKKPKKKSVTIISYERDEQVKIWIKKEANGECESCGDTTVFVDDNDKVFLEVHHIRALAKGGSDTVTNAVALCPNCHREFHYGKNKVKKNKTIYEKISRLVKE